MLREDLGRTAITEPKKGEKRGESKKGKENWGKRGGPVTERPTVKEKKKYKKR